MAIAQIRVFGDKFIIPSCQKAGEFIETTMHEVLGWKCSIQKNGTVICHTSQKGFDGWHIKRLVISPKGQVRVISKEGDKKEKIVKRYFLTPKGEDIKCLDVRIGLSDGWVDGRKIYVRKGEFDKFLDEHGITAIHAGNPNTNFTMKNVFYHNSDRFRFGQIRTDGHIEVLSNITKKNDFFEEVITSVSVTGASWVIKEEVQFGKYNLPGITNVLFTDVKDATELNLPIMEKCYMEEEA